MNCWNPNVSNILSFLAELYEKGLGFSSINTAKSALSSVLFEIDGIQIGKHPLILRFMKGIAKLRPPAARYDVTWDANKILDLIKSWSENEMLDLRFLTYKLVMLLALVTAQRVQTLAAIEISNIEWTEPVQILIKKSLKCTNIKNPNVVLVIPSYADDKKLCAVSTLRAYIDRTHSVRTVSSLFISYQKPHVAVTTQSISRWLCTSLNLAGIDVTKFHAHSFRHAATSKAARQGINIDTILTRVGWSHKSKTFARFYNRPLDDRDCFGKSVLTM